MDIRLAITGVQLITGSEPLPVPSATVLIGTDGRIAAAGPGQVVLVPADAPILPADGMTLLPGLIDGHVHLTWDKTLYTAYSSKDYATRLQMRDPDRQLVRSAHFAQLALAAGVTTLRDCGADDFTVLALRDAIARGDLIGPRLLACGRPITTTSGHIYSDWGVDSADEIRKAVGLLAAKGVDFIKLIVSGGTTTPGTNITHSQYTLEQIRSAVEDAHRLGFPVAGHAISSDSIRLCAEAGIDTIEHCSWIGAAPGTTVPDVTAVDWMVRNGVRVDHAIIPRPYLFPDESCEGRTNEEEWWFSMLKVRWPFLHYMRAQGVPVFLGTDAAFGLWPGTDRWPGFQEMARAVEILVRWAGFTPMDAIVAATREAARALRLEDEVGTLAPGKQADLVLLADDPLKDLRALRRPDWVFRDGRVVARRGQLVLPGAQDSAPGCVTKGSRIIRVS